MNEKIASLRKLAMKLPEMPGVYIMKNKNKDIIYIGKAKILKNRVSQYFGSQNRHQEKVKKMVSNVDHFEYILTDSEFEALVLECSLIKQYQPKYNILLKDDKGYHYVKITNEKWPKISAVNQILDDGAKYLGPYTSSHMVAKTVDEALKIFKLPSCKKSFEHASKNNRPCLDYYIKQCSAPCAKKISHENYIESVNEAIDFLNGGNILSVKKLQSKMQKAAENLQFEKAATLRDRIFALNRISENKQKVILSSKKDLDAIAMVQSKNFTCFEIFRFSKGKLYDSESFIFNEIGDSQSERMEFLQQYYLRAEKIPKLILLDGDVESKELISQWLSKQAGKKVEIKVPKKGENFDLIKMCKNNASSKLSNKINRNLKETSALEELAKSLSLKTVPEYIEAYDISNLGGFENVGAMVTFYNGRPLKSAYRKFKIKSFDGQDDYSSMREVIIRRLNEYEKLKDTDDAFGKLPDLILLDGGKGHVSVVKEVLVENGYKIPIFGMVKDNKHRTRAISSDGCEISISKNRNVFTLISNIQEEVHRFAIGYHRKLRNKNVINTELIKIQDVGKKRAENLLFYFKTIDRIKDASVEDLCEVKGITKNVAENIYNAIH